MTPGRRRRGVPNRERRSRHARTHRMGQAGEIPSSRPWGRPSCFSRSGPRPYLGKHRTNIAAARSYRAGTARIAARSRRQPVSLGGALGITLGELLQLLGRLGDRFLKLLSSDGRVGAQDRLDLLVRCVEFGADLLQRLCHPILGDDHQGGVVAGESLANLLEIILGNTVAELPDDRAAECADGRGGENRRGKDQTDQGTDAQGRPTATSGWPRR